MESSHLRFPSMIRRKWFQYLWEMQLMWFTAMCIKKSTLETDKRGAQVSSLSGYDSTLQGLETQLAIYETMLQRGCKSIPN